MTRSSLVLFAASVLAISVAACSSSSSGADTEAAAGQSSGGSGGASGAGGSATQHTKLPADVQTPPQTGAADVEAWLAQKSYQSWHSETSVHAQRSPSPHGFDRIYSNDLISGAATSTAPWPAGAAAVKELYATATDTTPNGYAVYVKTDADSNGGANWYWYERVPLDSAAPHDSAGVVADGFGDSGGALTVCVSCHSAAGSDAAHTPSANGHDEVYTPVN
jgi:hypothetical protein